MLSCHVFGVSSGGTSFGVCSAATFFDVSSVDTSFGVCSVAPVTFFDVRSVFTSFGVSSGVTCHFFWRVLSCHFLDFISAATYLV